MLVVATVLYVAELALTVGACVDKPTPIVKTAAQATSAVRKNWLSFIYESPPHYVKSVTFNVCSHALLTEL